MIWMSPSSSAGGKINRSFYHMKIGHTSFTRNCLIIFGFDFSLVTSKVVRHLGLIVYNYKSTTRTSNTIVIRYYACTHGPYTYTWYKIHGPWGYVTPCTFENFVAPSISRSAERRPKMSLQVTKVVSHHAKMYCCGIYTKCPSYPF